MLLHWLAAVATGAVAVCVRCCSGCRGCGSVYARSCREHVASDLLCSCCGAGMVVEVSLLLCGWQIEAKWRAKMAKQQRTKAKAKAQAAAGIVPKVKGPKAAAKASGSSAEAAGTR